MKATSGQNYDTTCPERCWLSLTGGHLAVTWSNPKSGPSVNPGASRACHIVPIYLRIYKPGLPSPVRAPGR